MTRKQDMWIRIPLIASMLLGIVAIVVAINWFINGEPFDIKLARVTFSAQLITFVGITSVFWFGIERGRR